MAKFYRVYSDQHEGLVFTKKAFEVVAAQIDEEYDSLEVASADIDPEEKIYDLHNLTELGYSIDDWDELTEQSDEDLFENLDEVEDIEVDDV